MFTTKVSERRVFKFIKIILIFLIVVGLPLGAYVILSSRTSEKVKIAQNCVVESQSIRSLIGEINGFGFFVNDQMALNRLSSKVSFRAKGSKGSVMVVVFMKRIDKGSKWEVEECRVQ